MDAMSYTGDVVPGGPPQARVLDEVVIRKLSVGPMDNNSYLLTSRVGGDQLLVDAAAEPDRLLALIREGSPTARLSTVVTTHRHADHVGALESVLAVTGAHHACGADDAAAVPAAVHRRLHHGDLVSVGHVVLEVVALRGHTPGSLALLYREPARGAGPDAVPGRAHLFTGDSLFPGGPGKTADAAAFRTLMTDLEQRVFGTLSDDTWVYPGHGRDTTLGAERPHRAEWWRRGW
ncbi:MBL fold metallo-hydrolase [Actinotalea sp. Marseille-Q4924]|uniref:MBL fold metallo-hydrolase n=1 Tax=Actinotalea sp. Marseille-Q4924 TaxID=2866571 RepID=UPI001CE4864E|nr:MBL fold metallo-hydrolase [Actinotalea sp. Marseille-Q4924]